MGKQIAVSVYEHVLVEGKWRYRATGVRAGKKPTTAQKHRRGKFVVSWYEGKAKKFKKAGDHLGFAWDVAERLQHDVGSKALGLPVSAEVDERLRIDDAIDTFLDELRMTHRVTSVDLYEFDLAEFLTVSKKVYMDEIERNDLLMYKNFVQKTRSDRTASNKLSRVNRFHRVTMKLVNPLTTKADSKYTERKPQVYTKEQQEKFFAVCKPKNHLMFSTFLMTGLRMQELMFLDWPDIDFTYNTLWVHEKPGFKPKTYEERTIPLPGILVERLKAVKKDKGMIFPTSGGRPNENIWELTRRLAKKAGLDPDDFWIHKWRATYCTTLLRSKLDLATIQRLMGHKSLKSTQAYLAALEAESTDLQSHISGVFDGEPVVEKAMPTPSIYAEMLGEG